jgi:thymidylate synthase (FAD)
MAQTGNMTAGDVVAGEVTTPVSLENDRRVNVLDQGFVRLIDVMGDDARIVQAARVSYGDGTKSVREDAALIDYLMRHRHTSPFEMVEFTFHIKAPIFVVRQWFRHRTASVNEISGRYSVLRDEFYLPDPSELRAQSSKNKQVGDGALPEDAARAAARRIRDAQQGSYEVYEELLELGVAREMAREVLPVGLYTEFYWKQNLHNLLHFLRLRMDWHAQMEIRVYADAVAGFVRQAVPATWASFEEHMLHGANLSGMELEAIRQLVPEAALRAVLEAKNLSKSRVQEAMDRIFPKR